MWQAGTQIGAEHFAKLLSQLPALMWSTDSDLLITSRWGGAIKVFGHSEGPIEATPVGAFVDPADRETVIAAHRAALRGESASYETHFQGRTYNARVEPIVEVGGEVTGVVGFAFDVTDWRRTEHRLRTIIESEPECVKLVDAQGRLLEMNPAGLAMVEAESLEAVRGAAIIELVAPEYRASFIDLHRRVFAGESGTLEFEIIGLKGKRRLLATQAVPLRDGSGAVQALLGITRDIPATRRPLPATPRAPPGGGGGWGTFFAPRARRSAVSPRGNRIFARTSARASRARFTIRWARDRKSTRLNSSHQLI